MKISVKIAVLAIMAVVATAMAVTAVKSIAAVDDNNTAPTVMDSASVKLDETDAEYYLRDCSGYVAVFKGERSNTPIEITEIETETLNNVDRQLLKDGIPAENKNELLMLLEDLGS